MNQFTLLKTVTTLMSILLSSCTTDGFAEKEEYVVAAKQGVNFCSAEFEKESGRASAAQIDRVEALVAFDKIDLIFAKGESGLLGRRDSDYVPYFSCGILRGPPLVSYFLYEIEGTNTYLNPIESGEAQIDPSKYSQPVYMVRFLRRDATYMVYDVRLMRKMP